MKITDVTNGINRLMSGRRTAAGRLALVLLPLFLLTQCFQVSHVLDLKDDGSMDVRWLFRFSKALDQAQKGQQQGGEKKEQGLGDMMEKEKKELPESLKGLVKNLNFKKIDSEYDAGMEISFMVPDYAKFPFDKIKKEEFPMIPRYNVAAKQIVFHFEPMKKEGEKKGAEKKDAAPDGSPSGDQSMDQMGKQISQLFLSSVRYQIFLGKRINPERIVIKKGKEEKKVDMQKIMDITMIDLPLFSMFGEKEEPFDMIIYLK
ncbi:MAG: hypothetical protein KA369_23295 [Spirochaetes bacterium]|nr:hypothetical protein [Spirochaetota bacterium]